MPSLKIRNKKLYKVIHIHIKLNQIKMIMDTVILTDMVILMETDTVILMEAGTVILMVISMNIFMNTTSPKQSRLFLSKLMRLRSKHKRNSHRIL